mgnify:CR=1 FL=1
MREYVQAVRAIWAAWKGDGKLNYEGKHYRFTLMTPNFVPEPYDGPPPRVGRRRRSVPSMLKVAAEESDDVKLHVFCTRKYLAENMHADPRRRAWPRAGRARESFEISGGGFVVTGKDDEAVARLFDWVRYRVAFYGSTPAYWPVLRGARAGRSRPQAQRHDARRPVEPRWPAKCPTTSSTCSPRSAGTTRSPRRSTERFGGLVDSIGASANSSKPSDLPPDLLQDLAKIPTRYACSTLRRSAPRQDDKEKPSPCGGGAR